MVLASRPGWAEQASGESERQPKGAVAVAVHHEHLY